ncbi:hypothetical protein GQ457_02G036970 [Hibiscus cannabinus]
MTSNSDNIPSNQKVQPQKRKKKQSMETKATDSNAVTTLQTTSSTIEKLSCGNPMEAHRNGHRRWMPELNGRRSDATHRNAEVAHLPAIGTLAEKKKKKKKR